MPSPRSRVGITSGFVKRAIVVAAAAITVVGCSSSGATSTPLPTPTPSLTASATDSPGSTATDTASPAATPTTAATDTASATPAPTSTVAAETATPEPPTPAPTAKPKPVVTPTPLPPLAIGLCTGQQLSLSITLWEGSTGTSYAHVTATNVSSGTCNMRGTSRAEILDGHGNVIGDAGSSSAEVSTGDPVYPLAPNGQINTIVTWGNWCKAAPAQKVTVAMSLAFGLGRIKAPALGDGPIPMCYANSQPTSVSSEAWLP